jgi:hypothetical protein
MRAILRTTLRGILPTAAENPASATREAGIGGSQRSSTSRVGGKRCGRAAGTTPEAARTVMATGP